MAEQLGSVLVVDGDIGFLLVLAQELSHRGISLIPSSSARQARSMLAKMKPAIDVLIINCRVSGVCALASDLVRRNARLEVVGIVSGVHQCSSCRQLLTYVSREPQPPELRAIRRWATLIQGWLNAKKKLAVIPHRRHTDS